MDFRTKHRISASNFIFLHFCERNAKLLAISETSNAEHTCTCISPHHSMCPVSCFSFRLEVDPGHIPQKAAQLVMRAQNGLNVRMFPLKC